MRKHTHTHLYVCVHIYMSLSFKICLYNHIHHLAEESEFPCGDFPGGPVIKNPLGNGEDVDLILAWELRSNTPWSNSAHAATTEPVCSRVCAPQLEKPGTAASEAGTPARESAPQRQTQHAARKT